MAGAEGSTSHRKAVGWRSRWRTISPSTVCVRDSLFGACLISRAGLRFAAKSASGQREEGEEGKEGKEGETAREESRSWFEKLAKKRDRPCRELFGVRSKLNVGSCSRLKASRPCHDSSQ